MKLNLTYILVSFLFFQSTFSQDNTSLIEMNSSNWIVPEDAVFETFDNRETLLLKGKRATVKNFEFTNGSIEVDVYANKKRSFAGITFRKQQDNMDEVYMRMHKSRQVDAVQYTPIFNNESNWQLYREYQAQVTFKDKGWNTLRIDIQGTSAEVYVNNEKVLTIDHLRAENTSGEIGLFALFSNRFSNFRVTAKDVTGKMDSDSESIEDESIITQWDITKAFPYLEEGFDISDYADAEYRTVNTETSGLLPISKYVKKSSSGNFENNGQDFIVAKTIINTEEAKTQRFSFDYSDKIRVYLNGELLFDGNNAFRTKGVQYMGHLNINTNTLYLPLEKGLNAIHCVVIDKANGWGLMGKLE